MNHLNDIPKKTDLFEIPEKYFDQLPHKIQQRVYDNKRKQVPIFFFNLQSAWKPLAGVAVLLLGFVIAMRFYNQPIPAQYPVAHALTTVTEEDVQEYLLQTGIGEAEILEICATQEAALTGVFTNEVPQELLEEIDLEDVQDYL